MKHPRLNALLAGTALLAAGTAAAAPRTITISEDRDQQYMTSKVYELKHVRAHNIAPYVLGAIRRMTGQSNIQSLDYGAGQKQLLLVSTSQRMIPYVDEMISMLDYPSPRVDDTGNKIEGTGISRWSYCPEYRSAADMNVAVSQVFTGGFGSGAAFFDDATNMFYFKTSRSEGDAYLKFLKELDRPIPQVEMTLNVYLISDNMFRELGIDYLTWKNGPGARIFNAEWLFTDGSISNLGNMSAGEIFPDYAGYLSSIGLGPAGGLLIAPSFDATFLRMLAQNGKAWSTTAGSLLLANDPGAAAADFDSATYRFKFVPQYQMLLKDDTQSTFLEAFDGAEYSFYFSTPIICFGDSPEPGAATLMGNWNLAVSTPVEVDNMGLAATDINTFGSSLTLQCGTEKLVAAFDKTVKVNAWSGVPFLGEIPVLKYLFGSESKVDSKVKIFITMSARPVVTENKPSPAAGEVIDTTLAAL